MRLFEIDDRIEAILAAGTDTETGEITDEALAALEELEEQKEQKVLACAAYLKGELAEAEAVKKVADGLLARSKIHTNRAERLRKYIEGHIGIGEKFRDARSEVTWRGASHVEIGCAIAELPEEYRRTKISIEPDKKAIRDAIKEGEDVPNCWMQPTQKVVVK